MSKKSFLFVFCILYFVFFIQAFALCNPNAKTAGFDEYSDGPYSYECNVKNMCLGNRAGADGWDFNTSKQLVKKHDAAKYPDLSKEKKSFEDIKKSYRTTQNTLFKCAILKSKYAAHSQIIKDHKPTKPSITYLEKLNSEIKGEIKEHECLSAGDEDKIFNRKDLLDSASYEECVYHMYLYYYEEMASNNIGIFYGNERGVKKAIDIADDVSRMRIALANEHNLSAETLTNALDSYAGFNANYTPHILNETNYQEMVQNKAKTATIMDKIKSLIERFVGAQAAV
ncbi:MAG: hypothetical protein WC753_01065 [Candidatus Gracilibacteria bacterium]|jgi:hypothetical protein